MSNAPRLSQESVLLSEGDETMGNFSVEEDWTRGLLLQQNSLLFTANGSDSSVDLSSSTTSKRGLELNIEDTAARIVIDVGTPPAHGTPSSEEALLNRSSVLFVAVSFILLMVISLAWLVFYYIQRFRYLHSKERVSRRLAELAKKAVARIPVKTLQSGDRETNSELDQCAICIEPYRPLDTIRVLPCRHYYHKLCIDPWLLEQRSCPMCKLDILQAYGLRTDFYLTSSAGDGASGGPAAVAIALGGPQPGFTGSSGGSDDGMERVALVHSCVTNSLTHPPLTYVVLTTAATTGLSSLYYVQRSSSEGLHPVVSDSADTSNPATPSCPVVVPVLPTFISDLTASTQTSSNCVAWHPRSATPSSTLDDTIQYNGSHLHSTIPLNGWPVVGLISSQTVNPVLPSSGPVMTTTNSSAQPEVTHTTQAFRTPVCSVLSYQDESVDPSVAVNLMQKPDCCPHATVTYPCSSSGMLYNTAIPSVDILHTDPSPLCPVTIPLDGVTQFPSELRVPPSPKSTLLSSKWLPSFVSTPLRSQTNAAAHHGDLSSFATRLFSSFRRAKPHRVPSYTYVVVSTTADTSDVSRNATVALPLAHQPTSQSSLLLDFVPDANRSVGSEQVVFAVVETGPFISGVSDPADGESTPPLNDSVVCTHTS